MSVGKFSDVKSQIGLMHEKRRVMSYVYMEDVNQLVHWRSLTMALKFVYIYLRNQQMIMLVDNKSPDLIARMCMLIWA